MRIRRSFILCTALVTCVPAIAGAQDTRKVGITMAYPAAVGVLWHVSPKVAIRPELSFAGTSTDTTSSSIASDSSGWAIGTGVSALFYLKTYEHLRTYVTPRFTYSHTSTTSTLSSLLPGVTTSKSEQTNDSTGIAGLFGAQYMLGDRFSLFGEVGFGYAHGSTTSSTATSTKITSNGWGTRAGIGVVFYP